MEDVKRVTIIAEKYDGSERKVVLKDISTFSVQADISEAGEKDGFVVHEATGVLTFFVTGQKVEPKVSQP